MKYVNVLGPEIVHLSSNKHIQEVADFFKY